MDEKLLTETIKTSIENECKLVVTADEKHNIYSQFDFSFPEQDDITWGFVSNKYLHENKKLSEEKLKILMEYDFELTDNNFLKNIDLKNGAIPKIAQEIAKTLIILFTKVYSVPADTLLDLDVFDCQKGVIECDSEFKRSKNFTEKKKNVLKLSKKGQIFLNDKKVTIDVLKNTLKDIKKDIIYFREASLYNPSKEVKIIEKTLYSSDISIVKAEEAPLEWEEIIAFVVYQAPDKFRFAVFRDETFSFAYTPRGSKELVIYHKEVPDTVEMLTQANRLISANRIIEMGQNLPENAFDEEKELERSLHVVISFLNGKDWLTWYPERKIPSNFKSLMKDCEKIGIEKISLENQD